MCERREYIVIGNWRMNGDKSSIDEFAGRLNRAPLNSNTEVVIAPPAVYLDYTRRKLKNSIGVAAQNCSNEESGAFTGEISPAMLRDCGVDWVILGHSERRNIFGESDELIMEKIKLAEHDGLKLIICIGETLTEKSRQKTDEVIFRQMKAIADTVQDWKQVVIAYEPAWTLGTGKTTTPFEVADTLQNMRKWLLAYVSGDVARHTRLLYGGLVTANNCKSLVLKPDLDGFLVSDSSLDPGQFTHIVNAKRVL